MSNKKTSQEKYDSSNITLHLDDSDLLNVIKILKVKISEDFKQQIKHNSVSLDKDLVDATQFRDWCNVEHLQNNIDLLKGFL